MKWRLACAFLAAFASAAALAQSTPIRILSGYPPGGNIDVLARLVAARLTESLGRPAIVDVRPGAAGQIAADATRAALADGSTLMVAPDAALVLRPHTVSPAPFNPVTDFAAVAHLGSSAMALGIGTQVPAKNLTEFVAWARANPLRASFSSAGEGASTHFLGILVGQALGAPLVHIPYKGSGPAVTDVVAGHIPATIQPLGTMSAQASAGKMRIVAVLSAKRSPTAGDIPTFVELGYPTISFDSWFGLFAPPKTPADIIERLNASIVRAMASPEMQERLRAIDLASQPLTPADFARLVQTDYERWGNAVRSAGFKPAAN